MKNERLLTALGGISPQYVAEADPSRASARPHRVRRVRRLAVLAAAVLTLALLLVTVTASFEYDLGYCLSMIFGDDAHMLDSITVAPRGAEHTTTSEEVDITLVGLTGDRHNAYLFFELKLPEHAAMPSDRVALVFDELRTGCGTDDGSASHHVGFGRVRDVAEGEGRVYVFGMYFQCNCLASDGMSYRSMLGRRAYVSLKGLHVEAMDGSKVYEAAGEWRVDFTMNIPDLTESFAPDVAGMTVRSGEVTTAAPRDDRVTELESITLTDCEIELSPMSVTLQMHYEDERSTYFEGPHELILHLSDGSVLRLDRWMASHGWCEGKGHVTVATVLTTPVDPATVVVVEYGGALLPLT